MAVMLGNNYGNSLADTRLMRSIMYAGILCILTVISVMSCDKAEKVAFKLAKLCNSLQADFQDPILEEELRGLSTFIIELRPKFTMYGFFYINQQMIPVFISALTTYLIILIQFKIQK
uniref:Gustatory receptor 28b isoform X1 n=1 Tax=Diabrotica virgifera virgifera TaxID=50390 RepID=A0A6P7G0M7_DIAVI